MLTVLHLFQPLILPSIILLTGWATYVTIVNKDTAVGFVLYLGLIIIVDSYLNTGIYIPGLAYGSIRYAEVFLVFLFLAAPEKKPHSGIHKLIVTLITLYFILLFVAALRGFTVIDGLNVFRGVVVPQILTFRLAQRGFRNRNDYR